MHDTCEVCGKDIKMMVRRGTGVCSERCDKQIKKTHISKENP